MGVMSELAAKSGGGLQRHSTVGHKKSPVRLHIYFSLVNKRRFIVVEKERTFTELKEEEPGKSLVVIQGECEKKLGLSH